MRRFGVSWPTTGLVFLAMAASGLGIPLLGPLLAAFGLSSALGDAKPSDGLQRIRSLMDEVAGVVTKSDRAAGAATPKHQIDAGLDRSFEYFCENPAVIGRLVQADFDLQAFQEREVHLAREWSRRRGDPWSEEQIYRVMERAVREYATCILHQLTTSEPVMVPVLRALLTDPRAKPRSAEAHS